MTRKNDLKIVVLHYYHVPHCIYTIIRQGSAQKGFRTESRAGISYLGQDADRVASSDDYHEAPRRCQLFTDIFRDAVNKYIPIPTLRGIL